MPEGRGVESGVFESRDGPALYYRVRIDTLIGDVPSGSGERGVPGEEMSAALADSLRELALVEGVVGSAGRGGIAVAFWLGANSLEEATSRALEYYARARESVRGAGMPVPTSSRLEVVSEADFDLRESERVSSGKSTGEILSGSTPSPWTPPGGEEQRALVGLTEVGHILGVNSRQRASQITRNLDFPEPVQNPRRGRLWEREAVESYALAREGARARRSHEGP